MIVVTRNHLWLVDSHHKGPSNADVTSLTKIVTWLQKYSWYHLWDHLSGLILDTSATANVWFNSDFILLSEFSYTYQASKHQQQIHVKKQNWTPSVCRYPHWHLFSPVSFFPVTHTFILFLFYHVSFFFYSFFPVTFHLLLFFHHTVTFFPVTFFPGQNCYFFSCFFISIQTVTFFPVTFFPTQNCYFFSCYLFSCYFLSEHRALAPILCIFVLWTSYNLLLGGPENLICKEPIKIKQLIHSHLGYSAVILISNFQIHIIGR